MHVIVCVCVRMATKMSDDSNFTVERESSAKSDIAMANKKTRMRRINRRERRERERDFHQITVCHLIELICSIKSIDMLDKCYHLISPESNFEINSTVHLIYIDLYYYKICAIVTLICNYISIVTFHLNSHTAQKERYEHTHTIDKIMYIRIIHTLLLMCVLAHVALHKNEIKTQKCNIRRQPPFHRRL